MMYKDKLVCCIKAKGKILREFDDVVRIPFGNEYSIFIKNLNTVRASVRVSVDGIDATENVSLVINSNSDIELTRFIKNGNLNEGNRFKFIERTSNIEQHRGVSVEDGLIRVEFQFEKITPVQPVYPYHSTWINQPWYTYSTSVESNVLRSKSIVGHSVMDGSTSVHDVGITVPGSLSNQQFQTISHFPLENEKHVIVLKLLGETNQGAPIIQPITVKHKPTCVTCGRVNKANSKFCTECGTALQIIA